MDEDLKICINCKHHFKKWIWFHNCHMCRANPDIDYISGKLRYKECWEQRLSIGDCNYEGKLFEVKEYDK